MRVVSCVWCRLASCVCSPSSARAQGRRRAAVTPPAGLGIARPAGLPGTPPPLAGAPASSVSPEPAAGRGRVRGGTTARSCACPRWLLAPCIHHVAINIAHVLLLYSVHLVSMPARLAAARRALPRPRPLLHAFSPMHGSMAENLCAIHSCAVLGARVLTTAPRPPNQSLCHATPTALIKLPASHRPPPYPGPRPTGRAQACHCRITHPLSSIHPSRIHPYVHVSCCCLSACLPAAVKKCLSPRSTAAPHSLRTR